MVMGVPLLTSAACSRSITTDQSLQFNVEQRRGLEKLIVWEL